MSEERDAYVNETNRQSRASKNEMTNDVNQEGPARDKRQ